MFADSGSFEIDQTEHLKYHDGSDRPCPICVSASVEQIDAAVEWYLLHDPEEFAGPEYKLFKQWAEMKKALDDFLGTV